MLKMMISLRFILKYVKMLSSKIDAIFRHFKWQYLSPRNKSLEHFKVHFLVVKDIKYIKVLKICIDSFLYWHPESAITIHADSFTYGKLQNQFSGKRYSGNTKILLDMDNGSEWQNLKLELITGLNGSSDLYFDADMRWNGCMKDCDRTSFLTTEFNLKNRTTFLNLINVLRDGRYYDAKMRNTSFFTFAGFSIPKNLMKDVFTLHEEIKLIFHSEAFGIEDKPQLLRISEQLALSLAVEDWGIEISQLKEKDRYKDGTFVESSYFGATGTSF